MYCDAVLCQPCRARIQCLIHSSIQRQGCLISEQYLIFLIKTGTCCSVFRFGRRPTILICLFFLPVTAAATALSPNIYFYMTAKFFCGLCGAMVMATSVLGRSNLFVLV